MKRKPLNFLKTVIFVLIVCAVFVGLTKIVTNPGQKWGYQPMAGYQAEPKDTIDVVFFGSSTMYDAVETPILWGENGITAWNLATRSQPLEMTPYLLEYASSRQPDALFVILVNKLSFEYTEPHIHYTTDFMPFSAAKVKMVRSICEKGDYTFGESLEFLFPMIRYHSRWDNLKSEDYDFALDGLKSGIATDTFMTDYVDLSSKFKTVDTVGTLTEEQQETWDILLDYIDENDLNVLFLTVARSEGSVAKYETLNAANAMLEARGYDTLDMRDVMDEAGLDITCDFFNTKHNNIHGAMKISGYIGDYIQENYGIEDKRDLEGYESWDEAYSLLTDAVQTSVLDFEAYLENRDYQLEAPAVKRVANEEGGTLTFSWTASEGADGYAIYRKDERTDGQWELLDEVGSDVLEYTETGLTLHAKYRYRVVPYRLSDGEYFWGKFDFDGCVFAVK